MRNPRTAIAAVALAAALTGCGGPGAVVHSYKDGDVTTAKEVTLFAQGSAAAMFAAAYRPVYLFGRGPMTSDCPKVTDDGTTLVVAGDGCTGLANSTWLGRMTFVRSGGSLVVEEGAGPTTATRILFGTVTFDGFGEIPEGPCFLASSPLELYTPKTTGSASFSADGDSKARFTVDLVTDGTGRPSSCPPTPLATAAEYEGSVTAVRNGRVAFTGSGTFGSPTDGKVSARTDAEVIDEMTGCSNVGASGTTTLTAGGHVAVVHYQVGAARQPCRGSASTWTLDGKDQGAVPDVTCATMPGRGGMPGLLSVLTVLALALLRRSQRP